MKLLIVLFALAVVAATYDGNAAQDSNNAYGVNTAAQSSNNAPQTYGSRLPHPGYNRVYDEFDVPRKHRRRRHRGRRHHRNSRSNSRSSSSSSDSDSDSDSRSRSRSSSSESDEFDRGYIVLRTPYRAPAQNSYGGAAQDPPAQSGYGDPAQDTQSGY
ncbi:FIP (Fungus-Induced Protein) Related [Caenorhabditis elegans]|uniref:FIP (Fungus-Induced Protein) Related n=1 Tax=Caenorhabditis elegans TaxID=6239 RepID=Q23604_CAEEL|nr:FIP (Fungus-Induced Protein) Related [Caenorhabditis elegans]CCD63040.1 FIP (Fungus-Induced Protein) Related [Caenorhabditis elegans]|eukprot:NP_508593.3 Uncharacterized protein CELE_ZK813.3 [Caenorhabditis elegans]